MPMRLLALLILLAVLPTVELVEQLEHLVEHVLHAEAPDHSAHHDGAPGDEHGCTGLVHLCATHQVQVTGAFSVDLACTVELLASVPASEAHHLADLTSLEPPQRPPIG